MTRLALRINNYSKAKLANEQYTIDMEIHLLAKKHTIGQWPPGLLMGPNLHPKTARARRDDPTQREHVHGELVSSWRAGESTCIA